MSVKTDATLEGMSGYLRISKKPLPKIVLLLVGFVLWGAVFNFSGYFLNGAPIIKFHGPIDSVSPDLYQKIAENKPRDFKLSDRLNIYIVPTKNEYSQDRARHYLANAPFDFFTGFIFLLFYLLHFFLSKNQFNFVKLTVNLAIFVSIIMFLYPFFYNSFLYKFTYYVGC